MQIALATALILLGFLSPLFAARLNTGLIHRQANLDEALTLSDIPRNMTAPSDEITIRWTPEVRGSLRYAFNYSGDSPAQYQSVLENPLEAGDGFITLRGDQLPVGYLYCIIDGPGDDNSIVFNIIRIAGSAPRMVSPITGAGRAGINTVTPDFRWEPVNGVPFYHVIVSDQPFVITEDEETGETKVEGSNVVWQAITSQTAIQYGVPDPSEFFDNSQIAPLVGSMNRDDRPRYAWLVLNNYGNHPAFTSTVTGGVAGFEVEIDPPFGEPQNIAPETRSTLSSDEIVFRWSPIDEAVSFFVYVSREEITQGGSRAFVPAWNAQTTLTSISCPAANFLPRGRYIWKVLAASRQGRGTMSDTTSFSYEVNSGRAVVQTRTLDDNNLQFVEIQVETIDGPGVLGYTTDDNGYSDRAIAEGRFRFHGIKEGYADTSSAEVTIREGESSNVIIRLRAIPSTIVGTVVDEEGDPVNAAIVTATQVPGGNVTTCETNISGQYQLIVTPGTYLINASANGYRPAEEISVGIQRGQNYDVDANDGALELVAYTYTVSGFVRNNVGQPISSATIILTAPDGRERRTYTPEAGSYSFVVGAGNWVMNATKPGFYLESGNVDLRITDRDEEVNFTLIPQAGILSGQVLINGSPANRNADVWMIPSAGSVVTASVNQVGAYSRGVEPGDYQIVAVREGHHVEDTLQISVEPGGTISGLRLDLTPNASSIAGRIVDGSGNSLREATVTAAGNSVVTDANGNYRIGLGAGDHMVTARKSGYVTSERGPVSVNAGQDVSGIDLRLVDNAGTISGRVRRGNDPIFDATVTAVRQDGDRARSTVQTDRNGAYSFGLVFGSYRITVERPGFIPVAPGYIDVQLQPGQNVSDRNFAMLNYAGRIVGRVSSPAGVVNSPVIRLTQLDDPNRVYSSNGNVEGDYNVTVVPERRYIVVASKQGYSTVRDTTTRIDVEGEVTYNFRLALLPSSITGTVSVGEAVLASAIVRADGQAGSYEATTDRFGRFVLSVQQGQYSVSASKPGYTIQQQQITVNPGEEAANTNFRLEENFALISGLIRDPDGAGIPDAEITAIDSVNRRSRTVQSGNDGDFQVSGLIPGNYHLIATHPRYRRNSSDLGAVLGRQERRGVNLTLQPRAGMIRGRTLAGGNPVSNATVYATEANGDQFTAVSDGNGQYSVVNVPDGTFSGRGVKSGYTSVVQSNITLRPADTLTVDFELILNDGRITGAVRDPDGNGLRDVRVSVIDSLGNFASSSTNAAGQFVVDNLYPRTRYSLSTLLNGYTPQQDTLRNVAVGAEVAIRMTPNSLRLAGRSTNQLNEPLSNTPMLATSLADGSTFRATSDNSGSYTFTGLAANTRYRIQSQRIEDIYQNVDTTLQIGANHADIGNVPHVIQRSASIRGRAGMADVTITTRNIHTGRQRTSYTGADGNYRIFGMRGGDLDDYVVRAFRYGFNVRQPDSLVVQNLGINEERQNLNFTLDQILLDVSGRVVDTRGAAVVNCPLVAWSEAGQFYDTTDANGAFTFNRVYSNQNYSISTQLPRDGYENGSTQVDVVESNVTNLWVVVERHNATISGVVSNSEGAPLGCIVTLDGSRSMNANEAGQFSFGFVSGGVHHLTVSRTGFATNESDVNTGNGEGAYTQNVTLLALDRALFGAVLDLVRYQPVPWVIVTAISNGGDTLLDTSNAVGSYQFNQLDPLQVYSIRTYRKAASVFTRENISVAGGNVQVDPLIRLPGEGIYGRFFREAGVPEVGGVVTARSYTNLTLIDTTDGLGYYYYQAPTGTYLVFGKTHDNDQLTSRMTNSAVNSGQLTPLDLTVEPVGRAVGILRQENGSPPATSGRVLISHDASGELFFDLVERNGSFELPGLRPGFYTLRADAAGYAMLVNPFPFEARLNETTNIVIEMTHSGKAITGYVLDPDSAAVSHATVTLAGPTPAVLTTNSAGYWTLSGPESGQYTLSIQRNGYAALVDFEFELPAGEIIQLSNIITQLPDAISGRVLRDDGNPPANGSVILSLGGQPADTALTDDNGDYLFDQLTPGSYSLQAAVTGYRSSPPSMNVELTAGSHFLDRDFGLLAVRGVGVVRGTVTHGDSAFANGTVTLADLESGVRRTRVTDENGAFRFADIPTPSQFRLTATPVDVPETSSRSFLLQTGDDLEQNLRFPRGRIRAHLVSSDGRPVAARQIAVSGITVNYSTVLYSDIAGTGETPDWLPAGQYSVAPQAVAGFLPPAPQIIDLLPDETRDITWRLGWRFTPPPPFGFEDSGRVEIEIPDAVTVAAANLFWRGPGASEFSSQPLTRESGGSSSRFLRSIAPDQPGITGADGTIGYFGYIPPQGRAGTLTFYLEVGTSEGFIYGGIGTAQNVTITARGMLDRIVFNRSQAALQPRVGVPMQLSISGFDDSNTDLTEELRASGHFTWTEVGEDRGRLEIDPADSSIARYYSEEVGVTTIQARVNQPRTAVTISSTIEWNNIVTEVADLTISAPELVVESGDSIRFTATATDTAGALIPIVPVWETTPANLVSVRKIPFSMDAWLRTEVNMIGRLQVQATDSISGISSLYNSDSPDRSQWGLGIYGVAVADSVDTTWFVDGQGFKIGLPPGSVPTGRIARIFLNEPRLTPVFRLTPKFELPPIGYNIGVEGNLNTSGQYILMLPRQPGHILPQPTVGVWNPGRIDWDVVTGTFNSDSSAVTIVVSSLAGQYALISESEQLGVRDLKFNPNPFSPNHPTRPGLSVEFRLTSNLADYPVLTVKIYNMAGQLVRTLVDSRLQPKGDYRRGGENQLIWDGRTDDGMNARNGRYMVVLIAKDASGESKVVGSAALIK
jgi:uncharacterized membrane protein